LLLVFGCYVATLRALLFLVDSAKQNNFAFIEPARSRRCRRASIQDRINQQPGQVKRCPIKPKTNNNLLFQFEEIKLKAGFWLTFSYTFHGFPKYIIPISYL